MKVLITGSKGNLGTQLVAVFKHAGHDVLATDKEDLNITSLVSVMNYVEAHKPDLIINAAAYNFVDNVEDDAFYPLAFAINATGPKFLAQAAKVHGAIFVHFSTDYVFAGDKQEGYTEDDEMHPLSRYGQTKASGERFVREIGGHYYICRLSKIFGPAGSGENTKQSFVDIMMNAASQKPSLEVVNEEVGSPTYTIDIAEATLKLVTEKYPWGTYHFVNDGPGVSWHDFTKEIFEVAGIQTPITPVDAYERPAERPKFAALNSTKFPPLRPRKDALKHYISLKSNA